jgi:histo-blood group ABO system transferase
LKIGLLVIATNKYIRFVEPLWQSARKHFLRGHDVTMFVFTDSPVVPEGTVRVFQKHLPWPGTTLKRYHTFTDNQDLLSGMDYLYYSDADMRFEGTVGDEILGKLVATQHPGFYGLPYEIYSQSYEDRPASRAYMPPRVGKEYYAGGFNGGSEFLEMARTLRTWVDQDEAKGIVAKWHDESHMNRYFYEHPPTVILSPAYCFPEASWSSRLPFPKKLLALEKNYAEMRS